MGKKPLVSICIPTHNRCEFLKKTLDSLARQPEILSGEAEAVISDNASTDSTGAMCRQYAAQYEHIRYCCNDEDKGALMNHLLVLDAADGILRKLCNDYLIFKPGSLRKICDLTQQYEPSRPVMFIGDGHTALREGEMGSMEEFMRSASYWITSVAVFALWDTDCIDLLDEGKNGDTGLWHMEKTLHLLAEGRQAVICDQPLCGSQILDFKNLDYGIFQTFYVHYFEVLNPYVQQGLISRECREWLEEDICRRFFLPWMLDQEMENPYVNYSKHENLKEIVFSHYQDKEYFNVVRWKYQRQHDRLLVLRQEIKTFCTIFPRIWLYGTGNGAKMVIGYLSKWGIEPLGCIVSTGRDKPETWHDLPVYYLDEVNIDKFKDGILVTVGEAFKNEIAEILHQSGYYDNICWQQIYGYNNEDY